MLCWSSLSRVRHPSDRVALRSTERRQGRALRATVLLFALLFAAISARAIIEPTPTRRPTPTYTPTFTITNTPTLTPTPRYFVLHVPRDYSTIQAAVDAAVTDDEIIVAPGIYYENIHLRGENIYLHGSNERDWDVIASTIIDGGSRDSVITLKGTEFYLYEDRPALRIAGLTIQHGSTENGGGICGNGGKLMLDACIIRENYAGVNGGGIFETAGRHRYLQVYDNVAGETGGGICNNYTSIFPLFLWTLVHSNVARFGGGVAHHDGNLRMCTIAHNRALVDGGGTYQVRQVHDAIIWWNEARRSGGDVYFDSTRHHFGGSGGLAAHGAVINRKNSYWDYMEDSWPMPLPSWEDPRFVDVEGKDFHLMAGSPAIGMLYWFNQYFLPGQIDLDFQPWGEDVGCYEYFEPTPTLTPTLTGDVVLDGRLDRYDLLEMARHWREDDPPSAKADLDHSGTVDPADLLILIELMR